MTSSEAEAPVATGIRLFTLSADLQLLTSERSGRFWWLTFHVYFMGSVCTCLVGLALGISFEDLIEPLLWSFVLGKDNAGRAIPGPVAFGEGPSRRR